MKRFALAIFTLAFYAALLYFLVGCASSPQRIEAEQVRAIEESITDRLYSAMHDRMDCEIVDRIESGGPGQPRFVVFEDNESIPLASLPLLVRDSVGEGRALCVERVPEIADLWEPARLFECIERGEDVNTCMTEEG